MDAENKELPLTAAGHATGADRRALALRQCPIGTVLTDTDAKFTVTHVNSAFCDLTGQDAEDLIGRPFLELLAPDSAGRSIMPPDTVNSAIPWRVEASLETANGPLPVQLAVATVTDEAGKTIGYVATCSDLSGIKQAEQWNRMLLDAVEDLSKETELDALGHKAVRAAVQLTGADLGMAPLLDSHTGLVVQRWTVGLPADAFADGGGSFQRSEGLTSLVLESGTTQLVTDYPSFERALPDHVRAGFKSVLMVPIRVGEQVMGSLAVVSRHGGHEFGHAHIPILEAIAGQVGFALHRQRLIDHLVTSEARLRKLFEAVPDILFVLDPDTLRPTLVSPAIKELLGFDPDEVTADPELWRRQLHADDRDAVLAGLLRSVQNGGDLSIEGRIWHKDGKTAPWFSIHATVESDGDGHRGELIGVLTDITAHKRADEVERKSAARQQDTLVRTIDCLARAMEKRDPYTSGHQHRVAQLAVAIAQCMGLDAERIEGIRLGALIHDVGKIYVPAEILNRPGPLTDAEFTLIKSHSEVGFEIVEGVEFPWPVANMIRQHHERFDGSGYPDGLQGAAISLEARVLAVADVVEAMTSHRPYRPSLGMDIALDEIVRHRGTRYDPQVADACLRVVREEGFLFVPNHT